MDPGKQWRLKNVSKAIYCPLFSSDDELVVEIAIGCSVGLGLVAILIITVVVCKWCRPRPRPDDRLPIQNDDQDPPAQQPVQQPNPQYVQPVPDPGVRPEPRPRPLPRPRPRPRQRPPREPVNPVEPDGDNVEAVRPADGPVDLVNPADDPAEPVRPGDDPVGLDNIADNFGEQGGDPVEQDQAGEGGEGEDDPDPPRPGPADYVPRVDGGRLSVPVEESQRPPDPEVWAHWGPIAMEMGKHCPTIACVAGSALSFVFVFRRLGLSDKTVCTRWGWWGLLHPHPHISILSPIPSLLEKDQQHIQAIIATTAVMLPTPFACQLLLQLSSRREGEETEGNYASVSYPWMQKKIRVPKQFIRFILWLTFHLYCYACLGCILTATMAQKWSKQQSGILF